MTLYPSTAVCVTHPHVADSLGVEPYPCGSPTFSRRLAVHTAGTIHKMEEWPVSDTDSLPSNDVSTVFRLPAGCPLQNPGAHENAPGYRRSLLRPDFLMVEDLRLELRTQAPKASVIPFHQSSMVAGARVERARIRVMGPVTQPLVLPAMVLNCQRATGATYAVPYAWHSTALWHDASSPACSFSLPYA